MDQHGEEAKDTLVRGYPCWRFGQRYWVRTYTRQSKIDHPAARSELQLSFALDDRDS